MTDINKPIYISLFFLLISLSVVLWYSYGGPNLSLGTAENILISVFILILILMICISLLPSFKDVKTLFSQIHNVGYVIIYTLFCILFYRLTPSETLDKYSKIILLGTIVIGAGLFYKGFQTDYSSKFNINYERIKSMILFFCFITINFLLYLSDPGGIISNRFGYSLLISLITAVFGFLYMLIIIGLSEENINKNLTNIFTDFFKKDNQLHYNKFNKYNRHYSSNINKLSNQINNLVNEANLLKTFSPISVIGAILFIILCIVITLLIYYLPGGIWSNPAMSASIIIILFLIFILGSVVMIKNLFPEVSGTTDFTKINKMNLLKRALLLLFGSTIAGLAIFWLVYNLGETTTDIVSVILNILFVAILLYFVFRAIYVVKPEKNTTQNQNIYEIVRDFFTKEYANTNTSSLYALGGGIGIIIIYEIYKLIWKQITIQGGKSIITDAISTTEQKTFGNSTELNDTDKPNYNYAVSMWLFIDAFPPNANENYSKYTSLIDFGNKPNILYNGETGKLCILFDNLYTDNLHTDNLNINKTTERTTLYEEKFPLQKWVNIVANYNGGTFDIFIDGILKKSVNGVVPYMTIDNFTIGATNGIYGGVKNVTYFPRALTAGNIYYLYHTNKL